MRFLLKAFKVLPCVWYSAYRSTYAWERNAFLSPGKVEFALFPLTHEL